MIKKALICTALLLFTSGCAPKSNRKPVSVGDVLFRIGEAILDSFDESEVERWRRENREILHRRREWQAANSTPDVQ